MQRLVLALFLKKKIPTSMTCHVAPWSPDLWICIVLCFKSLHQDQGQALHKGGKHNLANQQYLLQSLRQSCGCGLQLQLGLVQRPTARLHWKLLMLSAVWLVVVLLTCWCHNSLRAMIKHSKCFMQKNCNISTGVKRIQQGDFYNIARKFP